MIIYPFLQVKVLKEKIEAEEIVMLSPWLDRNSSMLARSW